MKLHCIQNANKPTAVPKPNFAIRDVAHLCGLFKCLRALWLWVSNILIHEHWERFKVSKIESFEEGVNVGGLWEVNGSVFMILSDLDMSNQLIGPRSAYLKLIMRFYCWMRVWDNSCKVVEKVHLKHSNKMACCSKIYLLCIQFFDFFLDIECQVDYMYCLWLLFFCRAISLLVEVQNVFDPAPWLTCFLIRHSTITCPPFDKVPPFDNGITQS